MLFQCIHMSNEGYARLESTSAGASASRPPQAGRGASRNQPNRESDTFLQPRLLAQSVDRRPRYVTWYLSTWSGTARRKDNKEKEMKKKDHKIHKVDAGKEVSYFLPFLHF